MKTLLFEIVENKSHWENSKINLKGYGQYYFTFLNHLVSSYNVAPLPYDRQFGNVYLFFQFLKKKYYVR